VPGGSENATLTVTTLPAHAHSLPSGSSTQNAGGGQAFDNTQPYLPLTFIISVNAGTFPSSSSSNSPTFLAEVRIFAGNFAPPGWAMTNGQIMSISQNTALFSLLGTTYGGDGRTTFALPDLRGRAVLHPGTGPGLTARDLGEVTGQELVTLTTAQLPAHTHTISGGNTGATGSGQSHPNLQPSVALNSILALTGTFPSPSSGSTGDNFLAELRWFAGNFAPGGWALTNGQLLSISQNTALFSLLGTTYGGDGRTNFALPELRGRVAVHHGQGAGLSSRTQGDLFGTEAELVSVAQLAAHAHSIGFASAVPALSGSALLLLCAALTWIGFRAARASKSVTGQRC
jgi:microcystin-dependent protein